MSSVSGKGRERPYVPEMEQHHLRWQLFQEFRKTRTYQNGVANPLRPLWKAAQVEAEPDAWSRSLQSLRVMARQRANGNRLALQAYVEAVSRFAEITLHVTWQGRVPTWACNFIHADVFPQTSAHGYASRDPKDGPSPKGEPFGAVAGSLRIFVNPQVARIQRNDDFSNSQPIEASEYMQFDEWEELRRAAIETVKEMVSDLESEFRDRYPGKRRPSTRKGQQEQLSAIANHLLDGGTPIEVSYKTLTNLAGFIGVDYPRNVNRKEKR